MRPREVPFWMICFLSCHRVGKWIGRAMDLLCDRPRRWLTAIRREKRHLVRGGGIVARISNINEPQIPVVSDDIPCPTARDVVVSRVGAVRPLETVAPLSGAVLNYVRLSCSDSEASDDDVLSVGAVRPLETVAPLRGAFLNDAQQPYYDLEASDDDVLLVGLWSK